MRKVIITRTETDDFGTFGIATTDSGSKYYSGELSWLNNEKYISCIPAWVGRCELRNSPKHGLRYHLLGVDNRDGIMFHPANFMGRKDKGLRSELLGCIALGRAIGELMGQKALLSSKDAIAGFEADLDKEDFELNIRWQKAAHGLAE